MRIPKEIERIQAELDYLCDYEIEVYEETDKKYQKDNVVIDDGTVHITRHGWRFAFWVGQDVSDAKIAREAKKLEKLVDSINL